MYASISFLYAYDSQQKNYPIYKYQIFVVPENQKDSKHSFLGFYHKEKMDLCNWIAESQTTRRFLLLFFNSLIEIKSKKIPKKIVVETDG